MSWLVCWCTLLQVAAETPIEVPTPADDRLVVELVAREPEIVTPTGVAVDERGRIWVIENQTHHRPADYDGPPGDRIRIYDDFGPGGRARSVKIFAEGFKNGMGLSLGPKRSAAEVYFATRSDIYVLRDSDGDDVADKQDIIVRLDTAGDYPHNGLSGFAFDAFDNVYFGMGENLGAPYKLIGSDGTTLTGGGEGGNIYRCRPDGSKLVQVATGFWNPFHLTFDAFGRLFAVDNDPDSRPPCRLLHIIQGGDYGYRFRNGRKGLHPFTAWNGELPGTLPMVAGTGEAPSGIIAYESNGLPSEYIGDLIVTSWGDHVIQRFKLRERGASFMSQPETLVRGGDSFYPVGIAIAPDGSLVVTDWADKSYPLHGKGRIWRIRTKESPADDWLRPSLVTKIKQREALIDLLEHPRMEIRRAAACVLVEKSSQSELVQALEKLNEDESLSTRARVELLWALTRRGADGVRQWKRYQNFWRESEVFGEVIRLIAEVSDARTRDYFPSQFTDDASDQDLAQGFEPIAADPLRLPGPLRMYALLGLRSELGLRSSILALADSDPFLAGAAIDSFARPGRAGLLLDYAASESPRLRLGVLLALRRGREEAGRTALKERFLDDPDAAVRRAAIQWVAEEQIQDFEPLLEKAVSQPPVTRELFEAFLAAKEMLAGAIRKPTDEVAGEEYVANVVLDPTQPPALRITALRTLRLDHPSLTAERLRQLVESPDANLRREAVRTLTPRTDRESVALLRELAADLAADTAVRADAVLGLANTSATTETATLLANLLEADSPAELQREAMRSIRGSGNKTEVRQGLEQCRIRAERSGFEESLPRDEVAEQISLWLRTTDPALQPSTLREIAAEAAARRPHSVAEWYTALEDDGAGTADVQSGERLFFQPRGPQCSTCHRVNGRGGDLGPDLSAIGRTLDREKLIRSILEPSKDIAPQYTAWLVALRNGQLKSGIILREDPRGTITLGEHLGMTTEIPVAEIEERRAQTTSVMPDNLADQMTRQEFRDLVEFLSRLK